MRVTRLADGVVTVEHDLLADDPPEDPAAPKADDPTPATVVGVSAVPGGSALVAATSDG